MFAFPSSSYTGPCAAAGFTSGCCIGSRCHVSAGNCARILTLLVALNVSQTLLVALNVSQTGCSSQVQWVVKQPRVLFLADSNLPSLQHSQEVKHGESGTDLTRLKFRVVPSAVPPIRVVLPLATRGAVLRETARLPQAATVMSPATTSAHAVMTSLQLAATVREQ